MHPDGREYASTPPPRPAVTIARDEGAALVEQVVLKAFGLEGESLTGMRRGRAAIAFARQVAIYVLHIHLGLSLTLSARAYGRDRTTAAHACRVVEDRRDDGRVDGLIGVIEAAVSCWMAIGAGRPGRTGEDRLQ